MLVNEKNANYSNFTIFDFIDADSNADSNTDKNEIKDANDIEIIETIEAIDNNIEEISELDEFKSTSLQDNELTFLYQKYKEDKEHYENEYLKFILGILEPFVAKLIQNIICKFPTRASSFEDFMQEVRETIWRKIETFDPYCVKPLTYFLPYIRETLYKSWRFESNTSEYYAKQLNILKKAALELGYEDVKSCPIEKLALFTGMSVLTITNTFSEVNMTVSIQTEEITLSSKDESPEEAMLRQETHDTLVKALSSLNAYQCFLVTTYANVEVKSGLLENYSVSTPYTSIKNIRDVLNETGLYMEFCNGKLPTPEQIEKDLTHALNVLRSIIQYNEPRKIVKFKDLGESNYEQADNEDIITAFVIA